MVQFRCNCLASRFTKRPKQATWMPQSGWPLQRRKARLSQGCAALLLPWLVGKQFEASFYVNTKTWDTLPKDYQAAFEATAAQANGDMMDEYDFTNPPAPKRLVGNGVKLHTYPTEMLWAAQNAAFELRAEEADKSPAFRKMYEPWKKFRVEAMLWHCVA